MVRYVIDLSREYRTVRLLQDAKVYFYTRNMNKENDDILEKLDDAIERIKENIIRRIKVWGCSAINDKNTEFHLR